LFARRTNTVYPWKLAVSVGFHRSSSTVAHIANNHVMLSAAPSKPPVPRVERRLPASLAGVRIQAQLLVALATPLHSLAAPEDGPAAGTVLLNLRLPRPAAQAVATTQARAALRASERQRPALRLEPRKSFIEQGIEGSREALIACQNGAYPGATVAANDVQVSGGDSQPGHCYRF
jgi:hypothetical protein